MTNQVVLNATAVMIVLSLVIPAVVGIVTKYNAPPPVKYVVTLAASLIASLINTSITLDGTSVISKEALVLTGLQFLTATLAYLGLYKPLDANAKLAPGKGIGPSAPSDLTPAPDENNK